MSEINEDLQKETLRSRICNGGDPQPVIVFLCIAAAMFIAFICFFTWHTVRMRNYELNFVKSNGAVVDYKKSHSTTGGRSKTSYYYIISYNYDGKEYTFTDRKGHNYISEADIGKTARLYINPKAPSQAEVISSAPFISIISACFFAFFCVTYAAGMLSLLGNIGTSFGKRFLFVWGALIALAAVILLLFWLGLPNSGFGEVFRRINGAVGICVISQLVLLATIVDFALTHKFGSKKHG